MMLSSVIEDARAAASEGIDDHLEAALPETLVRMSASKADRLHDCIQQDNLVLIVAEGKTGPSPIERLLSGAGFRVASVSTRDAAFKWLNSFIPNLVLVEARICYEDAFKFCRTVTAQSEALVVVFAAEPNDVDCVLALEGGASDYIPLNGAPMVLVARVRAAIRSTIRVARSEKKHRLVVDPITRVSVYGRERIRLTETDFDIFLKLFQNAGKVVSVDSLLAVLNETRTIASVRALAQRIYRIRCRFRDAGAPKNLFRAARGEGYIFSADELLS